MNKSLADTAREGLTAAVKPGDKFDRGKPRWDLLPWPAVAEAVAVLTDGAAKYSPDGWQRVPDARGRYYAALLRHLTAWWSGERTDPETGRHHLAHALCNVLFLWWFDHREGTNEQTA